MFLKHLAILCILSACCWAQEGKVTALHNRSPKKVRSDLNFYSGIPCYNGTGSSILIQHPRCRRSGPAIYQENCPTVSKADSDFEVVDLQETNVCQLRLYFQNSLQGCRCVVDRDDDCPVRIRKKWSPQIKSMDIIGHCTWKIFG